MQTIAQKTVEENNEALKKRFDSPFGAIARRCMRAWFNQGRLDQVLEDFFLEFPYCELVYAFDPDGRQVSSNIRKDFVDRSAYGQDLSQRPIVVSLSVLNNAEKRGAFLGDTYISQVTQRPCVTVMYRATSGLGLLGFIAADFAPEDLHREAVTGHCSQLQKGSNDSGKSQPR